MRRAARRRAAARAEGQEPGSLRSGCGGFSWFSLALATLGVATAVPVVRHRGWLVGIAVGIGAPIAILIVFVVVGWIATRITGRR